MIDACAETPAPGRNLIGALGVDSPWTASRTRVSLLLALKVAGLTGGALQGSILCLQGNPRGDSFHWERIEGSSEVGLLIGLATGLAVIIFRKAVIRTTLAAVLAALFLPMASLAFYPSVSPIDIRSLESFVNHPSGAGLLLGAPTAASLALSTHLFRNWRGSPRRLFGTGLLSVIVGIHSQSFFCLALNTSCLKNPAIDADLLQSLLTPMGVGGVVFSFCAGIAVLCLELLSLELGLRGMDRRITPVVAAIALLITTGLIWISRTMPLTPPSTVQAVAFGPDGRTLVSAHEGHTLRLWQLEGPSREPRKIREVRVSWGRPGTITFTTDGRKVLATRQTGRISLWDAASLDLMQDAHYPACTFSSPSLSKDGSCIAALNGKSEIWLWKSKHLGETPLILKGGEREFVLLDFSLDGRVITAFKGVYGLSAWDTSTGSLLWERGAEIHEGSTSDALSTYLHLLAVGSDPGPALVADAAWEGEFEVQSQHRIYAQDYCAHKNQIIRSHGEVLQYWDVPSQNRIFLSSPSKKFVSAIALSSDGSLIAMGDTEGVVTLLRAPLFAKESPGR